MVITLMEKVKSVLWGEEPRLPDGAEMRGSEKKTEKLVALFLLPLGQHFYTNGGPGIYFLPQIPQDDIVPL